MYALKGSVEAAGRALSPFSIDARFHIKSNFRSSSSFNAFKDPGVGAIIYAVSQQAFRK
jgi:hypothetical protein